MFWFNRIYIDPTPSSGLIGTAPDVGRLMIAYLNKGTLNGISILKPQTISMMTNAQPQNGPGLGWPKRHNGENFYLEHQGGGPGFATIMQLYPDKNLGPYWPTALTSITAAVPIYLPA
jgi:CubicO group peptidase (beta-lactamase class C family)